MYDTPIKILSTYLRMSFIDKNFILDKVFIWQRNRVIDYNRVNHIKNYIERVGIEAIDSCVYLAEVIEQNKTPYYLIIDGQHRIQAIREYEKDISVFAYIYTFYYHTKEDLDSKMYEIFTRINSNVPLTVFEEEKASGIQRNAEIVEEVYNYYKQHFKKFYKDSSNPQEGHFNYYKFSNLCREIKERERIENFETKDQLFNLLVERNEEKRNVFFDDLENGKIKMTEKRIQKIQEAHFYLFVY